MKRKSYIWLICLLVFVLIGVGVFFAVRRAATSGVIPVLTNVPVESLETPAVTPEPAPSAEIIVEPEDPATAEALTPESSDAAEGVENAQSGEETPPEPAALTKDGIHVHTYKDGVCTGCGQRPIFCTSFLPDEYYIDAKEQGKLVRHSYKAKN